MRASVRILTGLRAVLAAGLLASPALLPLAPTPAAADFAEYAGNVTAKAKTGLNGLVTFPADLVMATAAPREEFEEMPGGVALRFPLGLVQGTLLGAWRAVSGVWDLSFCWFTSMELVSPEPRFDLFAGGDGEEFRPHPGKVRVGPGR